MSALKIYISNDNVITLVGLQNALDTANYLNAAAVTVTLVDSDDVDVVGETWPLTMDYVAASDGNYRATLADTLTLSAGEYVAQVNANAGAGLQGYWELPVTVQKRTA